MRAGRETPAQGPDGGAESMIGGARASPGMESVVSRARIVATFLAAAVGVGLVMPAPQAGAVIDGPGTPVTYTYNAFPWVINSGSDGGTNFRVVDPWLGQVMKYRVTANWTVGSGWATLNSVSITNTGAMTLYNVIVYSLDSSNNWSWRPQILSGGATVTHAVNHKYYAKSGQKLTLIAVQWCILTLDFGMTNGLQYTKW